MVETREQTSYEANKKPVEMKKYISPLINSLLNSLVPSVQESICPVQKAQLNTFQYGPRSRLININYLAPVSLLPTIIISIYFSCRNFTC